MQIILLQESPGDSCFNRTEGLSGNNDGDPSNDFTVNSTGEVLSVCASASEIYTKFVKGYLVDSVNNSLSIATSSRRATQISRQWASTSSTSATAALLVLLTQHVASTKPRRDGPRRCIRDGHDVSTGTTSHWALRTCRTLETPLSVH